MSETGPRDDAIPSLPALIERTDGGGNPVENVASESAAATSCGNDSNVHPATGRKRIVICCDGTWLQPRSDDPSNVVKFARGVSPFSERDGLVQVVFYDWGVGTESGLQKLLGAVAGKGIEKNIEDAYRFLVHNYNPGDEIFALGFSRGAYTVRSFVGLVNNCGIIRKEHSGKIPEAFSLYRSRRPDDHPRKGERASAFRSKYSWNDHPVRIKFLGVWDTVGALGIPKLGPFSFKNKKHEFHDVSLAPIIDRAFHAIAIDEARGTFAPSVWGGKKREGQVVEQLWYAGSHSDIGGGVRNSGTDEEERGLADCALRDMVTRAAEEGLAFEMEFLSSLTPDPFAPVHESRKGLFKLLKKVIRPIGKGADEKVHEGVIARHTKFKDETDKEKRYAPLNVVEYVKNNTPGLKKLDL